MIFLRKRFDASETLCKWKLKIELQSSIKLQAMRDDNVIELKFTLNSWWASIDIVLEYIFAKNSIQNDVVEHDIKIIENQIKVMLQDASLSLKFWFEAKEINVCVRNIVDIESIYWEVR